MNNTKSFQIKIADRIIKINSMHDYIKNYCKDYIIDNKLSYDFEITTTQTAIDYEREKSRKQCEVENIDVSIYSDSYLETLSIYRQIAENMLEYNTILFHGSVISVDGIGYLFTAKSGTGKSTHTRLWREHFGNRAIMVNDDKPLISVNNNTVTVHGTPWDGKHRLSNNISVPLKAICLLTQDTYNHIEPIEITKIYPILLQQAYRPKETQQFIKHLDIIDEIINHCKFYSLGCNMEKDAPVVAYNGMNNL